MRIGLVGGGFSAGGIGRYSKELLSGLEGKGFRVQAIGPRKVSLPMGSAIYHSLLLPLTLRKLSGRFDLFHATYPVTGIGFPLIGNPGIVTWHDLVAILCKGKGSALHVQLLAPMVFRAIAHGARHIIADSSQTKEELITYLGVSEGKITVVNLGVAEDFVPLPRGRKGEFTVGYVGGFINRKRVSYLIRAFAILKERYPSLQVRLLLVGRKAFTYPTLIRLVQRLGLTRDVTFIDFLTEEELVKTYNSFDVFVFPSEWEGFGLDVLEAQRCGVPVVISSDAHIPQEVSRYCIKAASEADMAEKIYQALSDRTSVQEMVTQAQEYSHQFTWKRTLEETIEVYQRVLG